MRLAAHHKSMRTAVVNRHPEPKPLSKTKGKRSKNLRLPSFPVAAIASGGIIESEHWQPITSHEHQRRFFAFAQNDRSGVCLRETLSSQERAQIPGCFPAVSAQFHPGRFGELTTPRAI